MIGLHTRHAAYSVELREDISCEILPAHSAPESSLSMVKYTALSCDPDKQTALAEEHARSSTGTLFLPLPPLFQGGGQEGFSLW